MKIAVSLDLPGSDNDYVRSLLAAGVQSGQILHLPDDPDEARFALSECTGLLIGGGEDVAPSRYGEASRFDNVKVDLRRDAREFAAYQEARRTGLPLLAICRGLQLVNVARGGTLIQDIPSEWTDDGVAHQVRPKDFEAHEILVGETDAAAPLRRCFPAGVARVNSRHHQAVARIAPDLVITALAPDGIAEAVAEKSESRSHDFFIAVQWHPENLSSRAGHGEIFRLFVEACRQRSAVPASRLEIFAEVSG